MRHPILSAALLALLLAACATPPAVLSTTDEPAAATGMPLPLDPAVAIDTLANGLVYYIRENRKPEARAELRLVVDAGSILEDPDQLGLAHMVEHMAFNGTEHFEKQALVDYLESIGMRFGPDINASTGFDQTLYMLTIPTDSAGIMETAFQILEDWAHGITFDPAEVDKERGVVIEEWRLDRGASARMRDREFPVLLQGSRYAERLPIGTLESLQAATAEQLRRYYRDWYRPDLMAVVAVGDFEVDRVEALIHDHFGGLTGPAGARPRAEPPVPDHAEPLVSIVTDPEAAGSSLELYYKQPVEEGHTEAGFRRGTVSLLYNSLLSRRLQELAREPDAPFLYAYSSRGGLVRTKDAYILGAGVTDGNVLRGLEALLTEAERVARHGFTPTELERQKTELLRLVERQYEERDNAKSAGFAARLVSHYLTGYPAPDAAYEFELYRRLLPSITLDEVNRQARQYLADDNKVILVRAPEKEAETLPTADDLLAVEARVQAKEVAPYDDVVVEGELLPQPPVPGAIIDEAHEDSVGVTTWTLSNGARVVIKPTDFKDDEVLFEAHSPGGLSLVPDADYVAGATAAAIVQESGVGAFDQVALQKRLTGKSVLVLPWIEELQEGLSGSASVRDLETLFQLVHLYMTAPRLDSTTFSAYQQRMQGFFQNRSARPESAFADTMRVTMARYHPRMRPWSTELFGEMDLATSTDVYHDRFGGADDFTFFFVGNVTPEALRPLAERYLASLPTRGHEETWQDTGVDPPEGVIEKIVRAGQEPKSRTQIIFTGPFEWNRGERYALGALAQVLRLKLRETLREDMGGTYGVNVSGSSERDPTPGYRFSISFAADPERLEDLTAAVFAHIDSLKAFDVEASYLQKVRETQRRAHETNLKENRYWLNVLRFVDQYDGNPASVYGYPALVETLDAETIREAAQRYLDLDNYVRVSLYPMEGSPPGQ